MQSVICQMWEMLLVFHSISRVLNLCKGMVTDEKAKWQVSFVNVKHENAFSFDGARVDMCTALLLDENANWKAKFAEKEKRFCCIIVDTSDDIEFIWYFFVPVLVEL